MSCSESGMAHQLFRMPVLLGWRARLLPPGNAGSHAGETNISEQLHRPERQNEQLQY
jgi:hypothetical protein